MESEVGIIDFPSAGMTGHGVGFGVVALSVNMDRKVALATWRSKRMKLVLGFTALLGGVAVLLLWALGGDTRTLRVSRSTVAIGVVKREIFRDTTLLRGKVVPHDTIDLDALEGGQVQRVLVQAGDMVAAGQPLVEFRNTTLELEVLDHQGRLIESITQLQAYEKQLEDTRLANEKAVAEIDYNIVRLSRSAARRDVLQAKGFLAPEAGDQVRDELAYARRLRPLQTLSNEKQELLRKKQLPQIQAQLESLRHNLEVTKLKLDSLVVRAPVAGQLTNISLNVGQNRNRGERLGEIVPNTGFKITANVDEYYLSRVHPGQRAAVEINGRRWNLLVERVHPQITEGEFLVDLAFDGLAPAKLLPGQAVEGALALGGDRLAVTLPVGPYLEKSGGDWVMVLTNARRAERTRVRLGRRNNDQIEVVSGLAPGQRILMSDYAAFDRIDRVDLTK